MSNYDTGNDDDYGFRTRREGGWLGWFTFFPTRHEQNAQTNSVLILQTNENCIIYYCYIIITLIIVASRRHIISSWMFTVVNTRPPTVSRRYRSPKSV